MNLDKRNAERGISGKRIAKKKKERERNTGRDTNQTFQGIKTKLRN